MKREMLLWDETIFKDREVLEFDHLPEHFAHREPQMESLKFCVKPVFAGGRPVNALCLGPPGTGKTTAVVKLFTEIEAHSTKVIPVHVNCQIDHTRHAIFLRIYSKLLGHSPPTSGVSFKRVLERIAKAMTTENRVIVVALDDVNYLFPEREVDRVLYTLLRAHETFPGFRAGVIAILSEPALSYIFDPRVGSVFQAEEVSFPLYSIEEIRDILGRRVHLGFYPGVVSGEIIDLVSDLTERAGDLRVGIDLLKRAGMEAERRASRIISKEDVDRAYERSRLVHLSSALKPLREDELLLLGLAAEMETSKAGDLYERFKDATGSGYTRFHEILNKLDAARLIDTDFSGPGHRGRSRVVRIRYDPKEVLDRIRPKENI
ncbi:MAG: ORC1-type DNA replication protein [Methanothrix sp.]|jgi:cell division control protein 6|uniref:ORC1-type DNA replication protein n=1 Tax=Methanothrix harundinacea TaxID=301375 RepID=A0A101IJ92_9EURY|nr:MAG: cell division control protein 6 [Methanosaeta sp. SDB]KUK96275.1 MAG: Cell division control protein 6 [Methanothrix harundinacea]MDD2637513.1 ORC1-type DNA replication protein [Methanothrix sp.]MDI9398853.1 ORC1-type DNA replication protein [Euryarchaeota archaeon]MCP1391820.1 ORC1-type DNA replication protein [Methanothrix harundinacea]